MGDVVPGLPLPCFTVETAMFRSLESAAQSTLVGRPRLRSPVRLGLLAAAVLAGCGGSSIRDETNLTEEDLWDERSQAPIDHGAGPGVAPVGPRTVALGAQREAPGGVPQGPPDAHLKGLFGAPFSWPIIPIHTVLLPDGRVFAYGSKPSGHQGALLHYAVWDPSLGTGDDSKQMLDNTTGTDIFCGGQVLLPGGNVLLVGGDRIVNEQRNYANEDVNLFTPSDDRITRKAQSMAFQRWYATAVTTANGEQVVLGGRIDRYYEGDDKYPPTDASYANTPEVYSASGGWRTLKGAQSEFAYGASQMSWSYPRAWPGPDGRVVVLTNSGKIFALDTAGSGRLEQLPGELPRGAYNLPAAMYLPGKILAMRDEAKVVVIDVNGASPVVTPTASLSADRQFASATVLADGKVWVNGGSTTGNDLVGARYASESWDPATGQWSATARAAKARLYHSSSMLLPDGSVLTGGGGGPGPVFNLNAEIYYPPYLFKPDGSGEPAIRPIIETAPTVAHWGDVIDAAMLNEKTIEKVALVRFGGVTHAFGNDQRYLPLGFNQNGTKLTVQLPASAHRAPPGYYLLFALDALGVPSKARVLRLG
jgi:hypothetical protein